MELVNIAPQRIFKFKCELHLLDRTLTELMKEEFDAERIKEGIKEPGTTGQTVDTRLNQKVKYQEIHDWVSKCMNQVKDTMKLNCDEIKIVQSWGNRAETDEWHRMHYHPNAYMSSVLYFADCWKNADTVFEIDDMWAGNGYNPFLTLHNPELGKICVRDVVECGIGDLLIFPSCMHHGVPANTSSAPRYTMSFNGFPSGVVGNFDGLYGMEVDVH